MTEAGDDQGHANAADLRERSAPDRFSTDNRMRCDYARFASTFTRERSTCRSTLDSCITSYHRVRSCGQPTDSVSASDTTQLRLPLLSLIYVMKA